MDAQETVKLTGIDNAIAIFNASTANKGKVILTSK